MACFACCMPEADGKDGTMQMVASMKSDEFLAEQTDEFNMSENQDEPNMPENQVGTAGADSVFVVEIEKTPIMTKVGLDIDHCVEQALEVLLVKDGLVQIYNEGAVENRKIKVGDRIIEVNGFTSDKRKMIETVGLESKLRFVIEPCHRG